MKKVKYLLFAVLVCCVGVFTSCKDDESNPQSPGISDAELMVKIQGQWMIDMVDGKKVETDGKYLMKFESDRGFISASIETEFEDLWEDWNEKKLEVKNGQVILSTDEELEEDAPYVSRIMTVTSISDTEMTCVTVYSHGGEANMDGAITEHWVRNDVEYDSELCGIWDLQLTDGQSEYSDPMRVHIKLSGNIDEYRMNASGNWEKVNEDVYYKYVVAGPLFMCRWRMKSTSGEIQEDKFQALEVLSIKDGVLKVKYEYYGADETTMNTELYALTKVTLPTVTDAELKSKLQGMWLAEDIEGEALSVYAKSVMNFTSLTQCYTSLQVSDIGLYDGQKLQAYRQSSVDIKDGVMTLKPLYGDDSDEIIVMRVLSISDTEMIVEEGEIENDETKPSNYVVRKWVRTTADYSTSILGTWEGTRPKEDGGSKTCRWTFLADGTYKFYSKDSSGNWVTEDGVAEYFTAGPLLVQRWISTEDIDGKEDEAEYGAESWQIMYINNDTMRWMQDSLTGSYYVDLKRVE